MAAPSYRDAAILLLFDKSNISDMVITRSFDGATEADTGTPRAKMAA